MKSSVKNRRFIAELKIPVRLNLNLKNLVRNRAPCAGHPILLLMRGPGIAAVPLLFQARTRDSGKPPFAGLELLPEKTGAQGPRLAGRPVPEPRRFFFAEARLRAAAGQILVGVVPAAMRQSS